MDDGTTVMTCQDVPTLIEGGNPRSCGARDHGDFSLALLLLGHVWESAMAERLIECAKCSRHVKSCDATCPFCTAPVRSAATPVGEPYRRMTAAAAVAASVVSLVGCSTETAHSSTPFYGGSGIIVEPGDDASDGAATDGDAVDAATIDAKTDVGVTDAAGNGADSE
jgi:hypothetical protein